MTLRRTLSVLVVAAALTLAALTWTVLTVEPYFGYW
jgi:hypothetical protein